MRNLARLESGQPLPYVLGAWEFYGLTFELTPDVLIPRPETELLVEQALEWLADRPAPLLAADVGTGSGCIAISLAVHAPQLRLLASDLSWPALQVARSNLARHRVEGQISLLQCDLLPPLSLPFDLLVANLPYIPSPVLPGLKLSLSEPPLALDGGLDGLDFIRRSAARGGSRPATRPGAWRAAPTGDRGQPGAGCPIPGAPVLPRRRNPPAPRPGGTRPRTLRTDLITCRLIPPK